MLFIFPLTYHMGKVLPLSIRYFAKLVLKSNIFEFDEKSFKQKCGIAIVTKFTPPYVILFIADCEKKCCRFFKKDKKFVEVHRWHVFHSGTWWRITKCFHILSQITSPYNKVYYFCKNIFDKISFGRWYPSTRSRHDYFKTTFYQICK